MESGYTRYACSKLAPLAKNGHGSSLFPVRASEDVRASKVSTGYSIPSCIDTVGSQLRNLPDGLRSFSTVRSDFHRWRIKGSFEYVTNMLRRYLYRLSRHVEHPSAATIDGWSATTARTKPRDEDALKKIDGRLRYMIVATDELLPMKRVGDDSILDQDDFPPRFQESVEKLTTVTKLRNDGGCGSSKPKGRLSEMDPKKASGSHRNAL